MSSLYNLEPQPTAKVALHTTSGDILLELFAKQTPLTSRNFLQLCLDGYYDNTIFHRLVPGFIIQGGDPTGTGSGGESSYDGGRPFADEIHSRLKFNRRGLLGMANSGEKDDNGSQFFLTLGKTEELSGRNTMFGRVVGDTIYNLVKMGEADLTELEGSERPMYPTRITSIEILVNPFEDMVKRVRIAQRSEADSAQTKKKSKKKAAKQLLSFGVGEEEDSNSAPIKTTKYNPMLISADKPLSMPSSAKRPPPDLNSASEPPTKRRTSPSLPKPRPVPEALPESRSKVQSYPPSSSSSSPSPVPQKKSTLEKTKEEIESLKSTLKRNVPTAAAIETRKRSKLEDMIPATSTRGRKRRVGGATNSGSILSREEQRALDEFNAFRRKLEAATTSANIETDTETKNKSEDDTETVNEKGQRATADTIDDDEEAKLCDLHFIANCQSCTKWDSINGEVAAGLGDEEDDEKWLGHKLSFAKDRLGKSLEWKRQNEKDLVVIDPREKERELGVASSKDRKRERHRDIPREAAKYAVK